MDLPHLEVLQVIDSRTLGYSLRIYAPFEPDPLPPLLLQNFA